MMLRTKGRQIALSRFLLVSRTWMCPDAAAHITEDTNFLVKKETLKILAIMATETSRDRLFVTTFRTLSKNIVQTVS
jgi:hypothetical protein